VTLRFPKPAALRGVVVTQALSRPEGLCGERAQLRAQSQLNRETLPPPTPGVPSPCSPPQPGGAGATPGGRRRAAAEQVTQPHGGCGALRD